MTAFEQVSLLYWSFAFHFIAEPQNRVKLHSAASRFFLTENTANAKSVNQTLQADHDLQANGGQTTAHSATCSEAEVTLTANTALIATSGLTCWNSLRLYAPFFPKRDMIDWMQ
jgi:hypothetical protein